MVPLKNKFLALFRPLRDFFIKHPAVLSGYFIYAYFFITTMGFYKDLKESHFKSFDVVERFDGVIWMWLLAVALVKVIDFRQRLSEQERLRLEHEKDLQLRGAQLEAAHRLIRTLQHEINNPLTIILLYVQRSLRRGEVSPVVRESLTAIKGSAERIADTLRKFAHAEGFETVESPVGKLVTASKQNDATPTLDETRPA